MEGGRTAGQAGVSCVSFGRGRPPRAASGFICCLQMPVSFRLTLCSLLHSAKMYNLTVRCVEGRSMVCGASAEADSSVESKRAGASRADELLVPSLLQPHLSSFLHNPFSSLLSFPTSTRLYGSRLPSPFPDCRRWRDGLPICG